MTILHNEKRVKGWVCLTDMCKLVISAEVDLTGWGLVSGDKLMASVSVEVEDNVIGTDEKTFTVKEIPPDQTLSISSVINPGHPRYSNNIACGCSGFNK